MVKSFTVEKKGGKPRVHELDLLTLHLSMYLEHDPI